MSPRRRTAGEDSFYFDKKKKTWRAIVNFGDKPDGKRWMIERRSKNRDVALKKFNELKTERNKHGTPTSQNLTVAEWADTWLQTIIRPSLTPNGLKSYTTITKTWIIPTLGKKKLANLKPADVRQVHTAVREAGRASATMRKAHDVLGRMIEAARLDGKIGRNIVDDVPAPKVITEERGALTTEQGLAVLRTAADLPDGTRWWVALLTGIRQAERCGLRLEDVNLETGTLNVSWALQEVNFEHGCDGTCAAKRGGSCPKRRMILPDGFEYVPITGRLVLKRPKSGRTRAVPLLPQLVEALRRYIVATADLPNPHGLVWRKPDGQPWLPHEDGQAWRDTLYLAGIINDEQRKVPKDRAEGTPEPPTTHWARHTTATVLMELGVDTKIVGEIVGHQSERTTRLYQHVTTPAAKAAVAKLGDHYADALAITAATGEQPKEVEA